MLGCEVVDALEFVYEQARCHLNSCRAVADGFWLPDEAEVFLSYWRISTRVFRIISTAKRLLFVDAPHLLKGADLFPGKGDFLVSEGGSAEPSSGIERGEFFDHCHSL